MFVVACIRAEAGSAALSGLVSGLNACNMIVIDLKNFRRCVCTECFSDYLVMLEMSMMFSLVHDLPVVPFDDYLSDVNSGRDRCSSEDPPQI